MGCARYNAWLGNQARNCRDRDRGFVSPLPGIGKYRTAIHNAVERSNGEDAYTGEDLKWNLLNTEPPSGPGRKKHCRRGKRPSVDHYHGVGKMDYRICAGTVNYAKGSLCHQEFVRLCRLVAAKHEGWGMHAAERKHTG